MEKHTSVSWKVGGGGDGAGPTNLFERGAMEGGGDDVIALMRYSGAPLLRRKETTSLSFCWMAYLRAVFPPLHCRG